MNTLKGLGSDIKLRSIKQVSASLLADDGKQSKIGS